jgi:hypothetical protein
VVMLLGVISNVRCARMRLTGRCGAFGVNDR